jgi:hypothetical protein
MMYNSTAASISSPTYSLPHSRLGPEPSSSTYRYGFSICSSTDPCLPRQQSPPLRTSCPHPRTHSRSLLVKKDTGLEAQLSAHAPSACTATHPACIPTPQGSNAPVRRVDEECNPASLRLHPCQELKLSLGSKALEDWQM